MAFYIEIQDLEGRRKMQLCIENQQRAYKSYEVICRSSTDKSEIIKLMDENFVTLKSNVGESKDRESY